MKSPSPVNLRPVLWMLAAALAVAAPAFLAGCEPKAVPPAETPAEKPAEKAPAAGEEA